MALVSIYWYSDISLTLYIINFQVLRIEEYEKKKFRKIIQSKKNATFMRMENKKKSYVIVKKCLQKSNVKRREYTNKTQLENPDCFCKQEDYLNFTLLALF